MSERAKDSTASPDPLAITVLVAAAGGFVSCLLLWSAAQLTSLLAQRQWQDVPLSRSPSFLTRLAVHGDATTAWESAYPHSSTLEPPWVFWLLLMVLTIIAIGPVSWWWLRRSQARRRKRLNPAQWATRKDEARMAVPENPAERRWRLVAGKGHATRRLLAGDDCVSAVVFGPNGSGKTTSLIVPNVLDWDGPVVMTTAKPQDLEPICSARASRGSLWVIAPSGAPGHETSGWSPIAYAQGSEAADRIAEWMVESSGMTGDPKSRPWNAQARKYLKGLLLAANLSHGSVDQWIDWIYVGERARDQVEDVLRSADQRRVAQEYASTWQIHEEGKGSVLFTALGLADTYSRPAIRAVADRDDFDLDQLLDSSGTLCIVTPNGEGDRFAPYFTALTSAIIHAAEARAASRVGPLEPRLLLALDEAGNVFRYPRLPHLLTTARGNGIQLLLVYHDLAQVEHLYGGREVARTVVSNAKLRMLLPGVGDLDTLRYWSELLGRTRTQTRGETLGADGRRSRSRSEHDESLAPLHLLQQLPDGQAVLLYQNLPPARVRLQPWYADPRFRDLPAASAGLDEVNRP